MSGVPSFGNNPLSLFGLNFNVTLLGGMSPQDTALLRSAGEMLQAMGGFMNAFAGQYGSQIGPGGCFPSPQLPFPIPQPPSPEDGSQPSGGLTTEGDVVTTPGGYQIEMIGQFEWKITGPDGKTTRIHGDPHVDEGDRDGGSDWDFKRNSTFVLGDGTRINVTTAPYGDNGMTVTSGLEIISGNDRVQVSGIDQGKGQIGTVTQDGYAHANSFQGDVFVMGQEADDWSFQGREIIGSNNGGDSFQLGGELHPLIDQTNQFGGADQWANAGFDDLMNLWPTNFQPNTAGSNPYTGGDDVQAQDTNQPANGAQPSRYNRNRHANILAQAFRMMAAMLSMLTQFLSMGNQLSLNRQQSQFV